MTDLVFKPLNLQQLAYSALEDRRLIDTYVGGAGVVGPMSFNCTYSGLTVTSSSGAAFVKNTAISTEGAFYIKENTNTDVTVASNSSFGNPRIDQIVLRVYDVFIDGGTSNKAAIEVVQGTPTASASLDNRSGVGTLPNRCVLLADVILNASSSTINGIRDRRPHLGCGAVPPIKTNLTTAVVAFEDPAAVYSVYAAGSTSLAGVSVSDNAKQVAALQYLPEPIRGATRIRFRLTQGTTNISAGSFIVSIYDASGRKIVDGPSTSWNSMGSANTTNKLSLTITSTDFDAGLYYVFFGTTGSTASSFANYLGIDAKLVNVPNAFFYSNSGGVTSPDTILGMTDSDSLSAETRLPYVPKIALSVG